MVSIRFDRARHNYIRNCLQEHEQIDCQLKDNPSSDCGLASRLLQSPNKNSKDVDNGNDVHTKLVLGAGDQLDSSSVDVFFLSIDVIAFILGVEIFHGCLVLLLVKPGLIGLEQSDHFFGCHVLLVEVSLLVNEFFIAFIVCLALHFEQLKDLFKLKIGHLLLQIIAFRVLSVDERVEFLNDFASVFAITLVIFRILSEQEDQELVSGFLEIVHGLLNALLVVGIEDSEKQVHEQEQANDEIDYEKGGIVPFLTIRRQHHIWEVGRRKQHKHVEERVVQS